MQFEPRKRQKNTAPIGKEPSAKAKCSKEADVKNLIKRTASSNYGKRRSSAFKKTTEKIASVQSMFNIYYQDSKQKYKLDSGKRQSKNVDFILVNLFYNVHIYLHASYSYKDFVRMKGLKFVVTLFAKMM